MVTGMQKLNIPKTNSPKAAIALNLSKKSAATGNASRGVFVSTNTGIFSATSDYANRRNTNAPGFAQRTAIGTGEHLNWKNYNSARISADRHAVNDFRTPTFNNIDIGMTRVALKHGTTMDKIMAYGMLTASLGKTGVALANAFSSTKGSEVNDPALKGKEQSQTLSDLKNANDSNTLEAAITKAKSEQQAIPEKIKSLDAELKDLRGQSNGLKTKSEKAAEAFEDHKNAVSEKSQDVTTKKGTMDSAKSVMESAQMKWDTAKGDVAQAQIEYASATTDEAKAAAKIKLDNANVAEALAENEFKTKEKAFKKAEGEYNTAKGELDTLKQQTTEKENVAKDTKKAYDQNIKDIEAKQKEKTQLEADKKELDAEVPKQEARLTKLKEKEDKELTSVNNDVTKLEKTISDLAKTIDGSDGIDKKESKTNDKVNKKQTELDNLKARQKELKDRQLIRNFTTAGTYNGVQFKTGYLSDGSMGYVVGGKLVSQDEYNQKLQQAKDAEKS